VMRRFCVKQPGPRLIVPAERLIKPPRLTNYLVTSVKKKWNSLNVISHY
jgi:hypothetical protein